jgi:hypothetical protein
MKEFNYNPDFNSYNGTAYITGSWQVDTTVEAFALNTSTTPVG